jgi:hypothetical protein
MLKKPRAAKRLTIKQIDSRFPSEWILMVETQTDETDEVISGKVVFHSKNRDEVYRRAINLKGSKEIAFHYTGKIPKGTAIILWAVASTRARD